MCDRAQRSDARTLLPDMQWPPEQALHYQEKGYWRKDTLSTLILSWQHQYSDNIALIADGVEWPYWALLGQARRFATVLNRRGLHPGGTVLVQQPNSADFVVALFAVILCGAVPVLLLPGHRLHEIKHVATLAQPAMYLGNNQNRAVDLTALPQVMAQHRCQCVISTEYHRFHRYQDAMIAAPSCGDHAQNIALLLLSGGTTGMPKLIGRTHADYHYNFQASATLCGVDARDRYLAVLPMAHNFSLACPGLLGVFSRGGCVVVPASPSPEEAFDALARHRVTITALVPSLGQCWLEALPSESPQLKTLRLLQVGGAKLDPDSARQMMRFGCQLQQVFGLSEGMLHFTRLDDSPHHIFTTQGKPLCADDTIRVLDHRGNPVAHGEVGELWVRGPYTIRGYFRAPEDNRQAFSPDGYFRCGDRVRITPDGSLVVEGRIKDAINRHGESITSDEIEACLRAHPQVCDAAVLAVAVGETEEAIHAVVVAKQTLSLCELRAFLERHQVARFKWPDRLSLVNAFPLTPMGKVDKNALVARLAQHATTMIREQ